MDRRQTGSALLLVGTIVLVCGLLLVGTTAYLGISSNRSEISFEQARLRNAIDQGIATVLDQQRSVAWWDDAVLKIVKDFDDEFVDSEFGIYLTETYRHKAIFVLDGQDRPIYGFEAGRRSTPARLQSLLDQSELLINRVRGRPSGSLQPRADNFATRLDGYQQFTNMSSIASWSGAILTVDAMPAIVAAISISPNQNAALRSPEPYLLVSVVGIDQDYLDVVGSSLLLPNLRRTPVPDGAGALPLKTDDGRPLGYLSWTPAEPGRPVLGMVLPAMMLFVIGIGIFSIVMLRRLSSASHELRERAATAQAEALRDPLSQLPNRQAFSLAAEDIVRANDDSPHETVTIGYLDIDRFKDINDTLGHHMGDALIRAFADRLTQHLHQNDFLARVGGDEFAIIRTDTAGSTKVGLEEAVKRAFDAPVSLDRRDITVTTSLGLARRPEHGRTVDELMRHADIALYEAKRQGRNRSIAFTPEMGAEFTERRELEAFLKQALERQEFELHFQPILDERTGRIGGAETLLRWVRSPRGAISPSQFIPVAEEAGLMPAIGEWVLRETVQQASRWPDVDLAVNLSPLQFRDPSLVSKLEALCAQHSVSPATLTLEITEGVLLEASDRTQSMLAELKRSGFKIALDDFGTGYSSLSYLTQFSFNKLKIDQCFVRDLGSNRNSRAIVQAIVQMGHGLGMEIVAEGVETEGELETLRSFRCDHIQGFLVARPMTAEAFESFLAKSEASFVDGQHRRATSNQRA